MKSKDRLINSIDALLDANPWTNVYGLARSLFAFGTLITLLTNHSSILFSVIGNNDISQDWGVSYGLFSLLQSHLELARFLAIAILLLVISGWRPRVTGFLHCYVSYSFFIACPIIDGGDHITSLFSFLLLPICITDSRKWHWNANGNTSKTPARQIIILCAWGMFLMIRLQSCFIYFEAGEAKMQVTEWIDGTAFYYWATNHYHGVADWLKPITVTLLSNTFIVMGITWGIILLELVLAAAIVMPPTSYKRKLLLIAGLIFHFGVVVVHGLVSFFFAMAAVLILYLRPAYMPFSINVFFRLLSFDIIGIKVTAKIKHVWMRSIFARNRLEL